jgi:hypothetical protein
VLHRNKLLYLRHIDLEYQQINSNAEFYTTISIKQQFQQVKEPHQSLSENKYITRKKASSELQQKIQHIS